MEAKTRTNLSELGVSAVKHHNMKRFYRRGAEDAEGVALGDWGFTGEMRERWNRGQGESER
jgi:hypothetical protein